MKTIEEKLSAIKAINDEKDKIDNAIQAIQQKHAIAAKTTEVEFRYYVPVPGYVIKESDDVVMNYFLQRRSDLIAQAEQLMK